MGADENFEITLGKKRTKQWYIKSLNFVLPLRFQICLVNSIKEGLDVAKLMLNAELAPNSFCSLSSQNRQKSLKVEATYRSFPDKGERPKIMAFPSLTDGLLRWSYSGAQIHNWSYNIQSFQNRTFMILSLYNHVWYFNGNKSLWYSRF